MDKRKFWLHYWLPILPNKDLNPKCVTVSFCDLILIFLIGPVRVIIIIDIVVVVVIITTTTSVSAACVT